MGAARLCGSLSFPLALPFPLLFFFLFLFSFSLLSDFLLRFSLRFFNSFFSLLGQFGTTERDEVEIGSSTGVVTTIQVLVESCRLAGMTGRIHNSGFW